MDLISGEDEDEGYGGEVDDLEFHSVYFKHGDGSLAWAADELERLFRLWEKELISFNGLEAGLMVWFPFMDDAWHEERLAEGKMVREMSEKVTALGEE